MSLAPAERVRVLNERPLRAERPYVLYWMTAFRRTRFNFALEHAAARARELSKPLLVLEALRVGYEHASDRLHRFVLEGMADNAAACARRGVTYHPYVEPKAGAGKGLLAALAKDAALVVADDWPCFFLTSMLAAGAKRVDVRMEAVDACGILPLAAAGKAFPTAYAFRRHLQQSLRPHLDAFPAAEALAGPGLGGAVLPAAIRRRWPAAAQALLRGGPRAAGQALRRFLAERLARYGERNEPSAGVTSDLSPYLHFGHIGAHEVVGAVLARAGWSPERLGAKSQGHREGWWGVSAAAEGFLDQIVTWRELGFAAQRFGPAPTSLEALPGWAQRTLAEHAGDRREHVYDLEAFEQARTHDEIWNAAQRQLVREGRIHNYLRMLWGKKILEWSASPAEALEAMLLLNDRYALDGRDPNSASGILWVLGRFDRPWGPQRPIFGSVRYMSTASTLRKLDMSDYLRIHGAALPGRAARRRRRTP